MLKFLNDVFACALALIIWLIDLKNGWVNCSVKAKVQRLWQLMMVPVDAGCDVVGSDGWNMMEQQ